MNHNSLDAKLRVLTVNEQLYKEGISYYPFDELPLVKHNGEHVRLMEFSAPPRNTINTGYGLLLLKKHSRFQPCPLHMHNWIEINYMYSGTCSQTINNVTQTLKKGQVVLIDTGTPHSVDTMYENDIMVSLVISKRYLNSNFFNRLSTDSILSLFFINAINENTDHNNYILFHSEKSSRISLFFMELLCEIYDPSINSQDVIDSWITLILCELINVYEKDMARTNTDKGQNIISPILRYIEANYHICTLKTTAEFFNLNPSYLTTLLKQRTGFSYKSLLQKHRLTQACQMLRNTDMSIASVANAVGYENTTFFYRIFSKHYQCTPKAYREQFVYSSKAPK